MRSLRCAAFFLAWSGVQLVLGDGEMARLDPNTKADAAAVPVTRIACFKFRAWVGGAEKGGRTRAFLALYDAYAHLLAEKPHGGRPLDTPLALTGVEREKAWDTGFVVRFKNEAARVEFDKAEGHERLKEETDPLLEKVFVYDFVDQEGLGW